MAIASAWISLRFKLTAVQRLLGADRSGREGGPDIMVGPLGWKQKPAFCERVFLGRENIIFLTGEAMLHPGVAGV